MKDFKRINGWITTLLIIAIAAAAIFSCVSIYHSGSRPFNREIIAQYAGQFAWLAVLCASAIIAGFVLPQAEEKAKSTRDLTLQLARYEGDLPQISKERQRCKTLRLGFAVIGVILSIYPILYFFNMSHFSVTDVAGDVWKATLVVLIPTVIGMLLGLLYQHLQLKSIRRQIAIYQEAGIKPSKDIPHKALCSKRVKLIRTIVLVAALVMIVVGAFNGGAADVLGKAIRICTECIGLG